MSQVFPRSANALARASLAIVGGLVVLGGLLIWTLMHSSWLTKQHEFVEQPLQFSHAHHVGGVGLDCRYCHTSVEKSSFAGIPPTRTCMNCHSQLWTNAPILEPVRASFRNDVNLTWIRVNDLPDFVYFNHQIHVHQGVGCVTCHGPVDKMPLMYQAAPLLMEWCLGCHKAPENFIRPRDQVFNVAYEQPSGDRPIRYAGESFTNQHELGLRLRRDYGISGGEHLLTCSICHR